jgi:hypothetical protein
MAGTFESMTPRTPGLSLALATGLLATACGSGEPAPGEAPRAQLTEWVSPAGPDSQTPHLDVLGNTVIMSWWEALDKERVALRMSRLEEEGWAPAVTVTEGASFFVNWADYPSVTPLGGEVLVAHWLQRGTEGGYDYGVRVARSEDGGRTWGPPSAPHGDGTPTEHGFVSLFPQEDGFGVVWLDGRKYALPGDEDGDPATAGTSPRSEMTLRYRFQDGAGNWADEVLLDGRTCDCCQTDHAPGPEGPVVVYRDRGPEEIRDIYVVRGTREGWSEPAPVHEDGWVMPACPVNGPAIDMDGPRGVVTWFTAANGEERVRVAFTEDGGVSWASPVDVDSESPLGRVDAELLPDGGALVVWLARTGEGAELRAREVSADGSMGAPTILAGTSDKRASGFPQLRQLPQGGFILAWTDVRDEGSQVRVARLSWGEDR